MQKPDRLVTFLGAGRYETARYQLSWQPEPDYATAYVDAALVHLLDLREVRVLATPQARAIHEAGLRQALLEAGSPEVTFLDIPSGSQPQEQWALFDSIKVQIRAESEATVWLDITHGFRAQPFFTAAVVAFVRAVDREQANPIKVVYGEFRGADKAAPIWDLTACIDLLDWAQSMVLFLETGRVSGVSGPALQLGKVLKKEWVMQGRVGDPPGLEQFGKALQQFGEHFETLRTGSLLLEGHQAASWSAYLLDTLDQVDASRLPPVSDVLAKIQAMVAPLRVEKGTTLAEPAGQSALAELAELYLRMGRYPEAAATLREAFISAGAPPSAARPGCPEFSYPDREAQERHWFIRDSDLARTLSDLRNDILHAGYRASSRPPSKIREQLAEFLDVLRRTTPVPAKAGPKPAVGSILICTLGASWAVVPEIYGWLAPNHLDLYANHPERRELQVLADQTGLLSPDEVWVATTDGERSSQALEKLQTWWRLLGQPVPLRIWAASGTDQLGDQSSCERMTELIFRMTLAAGQGDNRVILCLAGGRKTMSADLQRAGSLFGCQALLHVVDTRELPPALRQAEPERFLEPLPEELAACLRPLVTGIGSRSDLLDVDLRQLGPVTAERFPIPAEGDPSWTPDGPWLIREIAEREQTGPRLLGHFMAGLSEGEAHGNWRSLYRLPPRLITALRTTRVEETHLDFLRRVPKAELHCHLGGILDLEAQIRVARRVWAGLEDDARQRALERIQDLLDTKDWEWEWPARLGAGNAKAEATCALLVHCLPEQLARNLWSQEPRRGLKRHHPAGFSAYERPGVLTGSAILFHDGALEGYVEEVVATARSHGVRYLELRGKYSPDKADYLRRLRELVEAKTKSEDDPVIRFIRIIDRRDVEDYERIVADTVTGLKDRNFLVGLDVAGDEDQGPPTELAPSFESAFECCLPITIHAGEGTTVERVWESAYLLHADRIGHGLSLVDNESLARRFRARRICVELCPTSNLEVVGFHEPHDPDPRFQTEYPLRKLLEWGIPVTLCTDNPGISRTELAREYLIASRLMMEGMSLWQALSLIRQGFLHAFLDVELRDELLRKADQEIYQLVLQHFSESG